MKGDFTRQTYKTENHYSSVRMQQGRVQLDADWNEQADIAAHRVEREAGDVIGLCGAPLHAAAFGILPDTSTLTADEVTRLTQAGLLPLASGDFLLTPGRYYVAGVLCENEDYVTFAHQPDLPGQTPLGAAGDYLVYLDVWQRHLTALEAEQIREVALGGPDTATRQRTTWQVRAMSVPADTNCLSDLAGWDTLVAGSTGQLSARAQPQQDSSDPCIVPPTAGFRGLQNQLYRVEIHLGGGLGAATFKWSRDNGSLVFAVEEFMSGQPTDRLRLRSLGRDQDLGLRIGDWVEVLDDEHELTATPGDLLQITDIDQDDLILTLSADVSGYSDNHPKVRRWDSDGPLSVEVPVENDGWISLEDGVEVHFEDGSFQTGDYWMIPARTILGTPLLIGTGGIEWPADPSTGDPLPEPPAGIHHDYCRLALVNFDGTKVAVTSDCRSLFPPITELTQLYYVSGDGQEAMPGDALPQPLLAGVSNGQWPLEGAQVRFSLVLGSGVLTTGANSGNQVIAVTDSNGIAACTWQLDQTTLSQRVEAVLLDSAADPQGLPVGYNANLSLADQVAYQGECKGLANAETVQDALDELCQNAALYYVGGDGQQGAPGAVLAFPLEARLANGSWPVEGQNVIFKILEPGFGVLSSGGSSGQEVTVVTDADGLATCTWQLDSQNPSQQVVAFWEKQAELYLHYDATFATGGGQEQPGIKIKDVILSSTNKPLVHDSEIAAPLLVEGIQVICDQEPNHDNVKAKPVCYVTLDLPFPFNDADFSVWGEAVIGFRPLILAADVTTDNEIIFWAPADAVKGFLQQQLFEQMLKFNRGRIVLAHLTLKGNFIWSQKDENVYLDGEAFGAPAGETPNNLRLPSGDGVRGGDFEMWFWLVQG